jgi:hypothetical protein
VVGDDRAEPVVGLGGRDRLNLGVLRVVHGAGELLEPGTRRGRDHDDVHLVLELLVRCGTQNSWRWSRRVVPV